MSSTLNLILYKKNTQFFCKNCDDLLFVINQDVFQNDYMSTNQIYQDQGQAPWFTHQAQVCRKCGVDYSNKNFNTNYVKQEINKLKVGIVGLGFVGSTLKRWFELNTIHEIKCLDPVLDFNDDFEDVDAIFICIPVFSSMDGQSIAALEGIVNRFRGITEHIFIRSTVLMGVNDKLGTISMPEFFTQRTADEDAKRLPILCGPCDSKILNDLFPNKIIIQMSNLECELSKYAHNCFGALKVTYFNMLNNIAKYHDANIENIKEGMGISGYIDLKNHTQVPGPDGKLGYGGKCFPQNMESFLGYLNSNDFQSEADFIKLIIDLNLSYRGTDK